MPTTNDKRAQAGAGARKGRRGPAAPAGVDPRGPVTGLRLPSDLVKQAKHQAIDEGLTLRELVEDALRRRLAGPRR